MRKIFAKLLTLLLLFLVACDKEDQIEIPHEEELITTVKVTLTNESNLADEVTFIYKDLDGDGGNAPVYTIPSLKPNTTYNAVITLFNEQGGVVKNISDEVLEEALEHQLFFIGSGVTVVYNDKDALEQPIGLLNKLTTGVANSNATLQVILKHEPNKSDASVKSGNLNNAGGTTDVDVTFNFVIAP